MKKFACLALCLTASSFILGCGGSTTPPAATPAAAPAADAAAPAGDAAAPADAPKP